MAEEENNGYQIDSAPDVKYKHFKELKKFPDILGNYSNKGWFTDSSLTSIMYSSGYTDINNTDQNLVKLFDASTQTGFRMSEGEAKGQQLTGKCYIENFADEKYDDLKFENIDNLEKLFKGDYRYICGSKKSKIDIGTVIASATRYKDKLKNLDINTKKLIRKSNHIGDKNYRIYLVNSEYSNYGNQRIIKDIVKEQNYDKCFDDETQSKFENAFKSKNFEGNFKFIKDTEDKLNNLISETISEENYEQIVDSSIEIINDFLKQLKNSETIFKDYLILLEYAKYYINKPKMPIKWEVDEFNFTFKQISKGKVDPKKETDCKKLTNEIGVIVSAIEDLYKYIQKEYETGIGWTIDENNNLSIQKDYENIGDSKIYYFDDENEHTFLDYTSTNNKNFSGIVSERAEEATDGLQGNLADYYLVGIKLYLGFRDKNLKESIDIEGMLNKPITANNNIKEIGFFFRKKRDDEKKLYRYVVNLETYKTVIKSKYEDKEPLYFVPFITETLGDRKTQNYEAWYGKIKGNKYIPFTSLNKEEKNENFVDARVCLNLGKFEGDLYGLNGLPTQEAKSLKTLNLIVNENSSAKVAYYINDWTNETKENTDNFIKEEITAEDLKGIVIGCFTKDKPWTNARPDGWAYTSNPNTFKVNLKQQKEETIITEENSNPRTRGLSGGATYKNFVNETRYYFNAIIKDESGNETKVYDINFRDLFDDEKFTMSTFEADINENGKKIQYTQEDDTKELEKQVGLNRIISPGDTIFKATFTVEDIDYYNNILYQITKIGSKEIDTLQRGNGEAADYYNISDSLVNRVAENECYVGIDGLIKTSVPSDDNSKCAMYLDTAVDVMTIGFGITYAAFEAVEAIQPETETYKAMKKFQEENPDRFKRRNSGQLEYIYISGQRAKSWKEYINKKNPTNTNAYLIAPEEYAVTVKDSKFCMKQILHDTYLPLVIKDLVEVYKVLYGINGEFTAEDLKNSVLKYISQTALDILVDCKYNGSYGKTYFIDPLITKIKKELSGKNASELTDDERYTILNKCMRIQAEEASKEKNTINNRLKQFGKNLDDFYLIQKNAKYSTTDKKNTGPLTIELECISNVNGFVESIFGDAFYQFKR